MAVLKGVIGLYRAGKEKTTERYKARIKIGEEHRSISAFKKISSIFLVLTTKPRSSG